MILDTQPCDYPPADEGKVITLVKDGHYQIICRMSHGYVTWHRIDYPKKRHA